MVNFVIVEDNSESRSSIKNIVVSKMMKNKIDFKIYEFSDINKDISKFLKENTADSIYILDLELPNGDGIDVARLIRNKYNNWSSPIVIITAHSSLYYEVYKQRLQILDFICKSDNVKKNLSENIDICLRMLNKEKVYRYTYKNIDYTINFHNINYIQRDGRRTKIVTKDKEYFQNVSIANIRKELPDYFRVSSKGTVINIKNVSKIDWQEYKVYFNNGSSAFVVSRSHKKEIDNYEHN